MIPQAADAPATIRYAMSFTSWHSLWFRNDVSIIYHESVAEAEEPDSEFAGPQRSLCEPKVYLIGNGQIVHEGCEAPFRVCKRCRAVRARGKVDGTPG